MHISCPPPPQANCNHLYLTRSHQFCIHCCEVGDPLWRKMQCQISQPVRLGSPPHPVQSTTLLVQTPRGGAWKWVLVQSHAPPWFRSASKMPSLLFQGFLNVVSYSQTTCRDYRIFLPLSSKIIHMNSRHKYSL
jgi:hypothetical protein